MSVFFVVNEGIIVGADVRCQVLQRGVARNMMLRYQTTLSTAAQRFAAQDVTLLILRESDGYTTERNRCFRN